MNMYMGNSSTAKVIGRGSIELHFTYGKTILLSEVLHVRDVRKDIVSCALLSMGLKYIFLSLTSLF